MTENYLRVQKNRALPIEDPVSYCKINFWINI